MAANALVGSSLDYCKLQYFQNSLARIITITTKNSHITPDGKPLHCLTIEHNFVFKTVLLVYICMVLQNSYPKYFEPFLKPRHSA